MTRTSSDVSVTIPLASCMTSFVHLLLHLSGLYLSSLISLFCIWVYFHLLVTYIDLSIQLHVPCSKILTRARHFRFVCLLVCLLSIAVVLCPHPQQCLKGVPRAMSLFYVSSIFAISRRVLSPLSGSGLRRHHLSHVVDSLRIYLCPSAPV